MCRCHSATTGRGFLDALEVALCSVFDSLLVHEAKTGMALGTFGQLLGEVGLLIIA